MIDAAFFSLLLVALCTRNFSAIVFVTACILHDLLFSQYGGFLYYGSAAIFAYCSLSLVDTSSSLQFSCIASIILNTFGYIAWFLYYPPNLYNHAFLSLYIITAVMCIKDWRDGAGNYRGDWRGVGVGSFSESFNFLRDHGASK